MQHIRAEAHIDVPFDDVWEFFCETSRWDEWDPRDKHSDWSGPMSEVGTTWVETGKFMGIEKKGTMTVIEVEPERFLHYRADSGPLEVFYRFEPEGSGTRTTVEMDYEMPGPAFLRASLTKVMTKVWFEGYVNRVIANFKTLAEAKALSHA